jgi:hypothetical protein
MIESGNLGSGHTEGIHNPVENVPKEYLKIPDGTTYSNTPGEL